jgi:hypothetical protein
VFAVFPYKKRLSIFLLLCAILTVFLPIQAQENSRVGLDLNAYCNAHNYVEAALIRPDDAFAWQCRDAQGGYHQIDIAVLCLEQHNGTHNFVGLDSATNPYGWSCNSLEQPPLPQPPSQSFPTPIPTQTHLPQNQSVGTDLGAYCRSIGAQGDHSAGDFALDWYCDFGNGNQQPINLTNLCIWQNGGSYPFPSIADPYNKWTLSCNTLPQNPLPNEPRTPLQPTATVTPVQVPSATATPLPQNQSVGMDLGAYCRSIGAQGDHSAGDFALDWYCNFGNGNLQPVDLIALCIWQNGGSHPFPSITDPYNKWTLSCNTLPQNPLPNEPRTSLQPTVTITHTPTSQPIMVIPTATQLPTIRPCPVGAGPRGIVAGDYPPSKLYQDERQWLFEVFGNQGIAPIGYGGEKCGTRVEDPIVNFNHFICNQGLRGPDGIPAGDYHPARLRSDEKQWLFEVFRNQGQAPVGYGGEFCQGQTTDPLKNLIIYVCSKNLISPSGHRTDEYPAGTISDADRQWLFEVFRNNGQVPVGYNGDDCDGQPANLYDASYMRRARICNSSATGPYGMIPGNYTVDQLYYDERAWLYYIFENTGDVPVGYGGEPCPGQTSNYPPPDRSKPYNANTRQCPSGVGAPGSYDPQSLTQQQRNELYWAFGHSGEAPVGYGGEYCSGGNMTLPSFINSSNSNPSSDSGVELTKYPGFPSLPQIPDNYVRILDENVLLRSEPGMHGTGIGYLRKGHYYILVEEGSGWFKLLPPNWLGPASFGWIQMGGNVERHLVASASVNLVAPDFPPPITGFSGTEICGNFGNPHWSRSKFNSPVCLHKHKWVSIIETDEYIPLIFHCYDTPDKKTGGNPFGYARVDNVYEGESWTYPDNSLFSYSWVPRGIAPETITFSYSMLVCGLP